MHINTREAIKVVPGVLPVLYTFCNESPRKGNPQEHCKDVHKNLRNVMLHQTMGPSSLVFSTSYWHRMGVKKKSIYAGIIQAEPFPTPLPLELPAFGGLGSPNMTHLFLYSKDRFSKTPSLN